MRRSKQWTGDRQQATGNVGAYASDIACCLLPVACRLFPVPCCFFLATRPGQPAPHQAPSVAGSVNQSSSDNGPPNSFSTDLMSEMFRVSVLLRSLSV